MLNKFFNDLKKGKYTVVILIIFLSIIALIYFFSLQGKGNNTSSENEYVDRLETKLSKVLSKIDKAGKVDVVITLESGAETVFATKKNIDAKSGQIIEETPVIVNGKTVVTKENYPKILGVLIVAEGADNISVRTKLLSATKSLLDIDTDKIEIMTMK